MALSAIAIALYVLTAYSHAPHDQHFFVALGHVAVVSGTVAYLGVQVYRGRLVNRSFWILLVYTGCTVVGGGGTLVAGGVADNSPPPYVAVLGIVAAMLLIASVVALGRVRKGSSVSEP